MNKTTQTKAQSYIESFGYKLLSEYNGYHYKIEIECPVGHKYKIRYDAFYRGDRCKICKSEEKSRYYLKKINKFCKSIGYECLSTEYITAHTLLLLRCPYGHPYKSSWNNFKGKDGRRCFICHCVNITGPGNPSWKGGISQDPYCISWADKELKHYIKERDGFKCLNPECNKISNKLCIHHVNYNKKDCDPKNLITVCLSCNTKANKDRQWHISWYRAILAKRYGYIYKEV